MPINTELAFMFAVSCIALSSHENQRHLHIMRILLTNDDGVGAPGLRLLQQIAGEFGDVVTVAPDRQQSGISHKLSFERPLKIESLGDQVYGVDGTPADCVRVAIAKFGSQFDWVLSGINDGANLGCDVFYSGTVAAAREACLQRIPAIAISQYRQHYAADFDWQGQVSTVRRVFKSYLTTKLRAEQWININLPDMGAEETAEIVQCDVDTNPLPACYVEADGHWEWRLRYADRPRDIGKDTDVCLSGRIAVSLCDIV